MDTNINNKSLIIWEAIKNIGHKMVKSDKSLSICDKIRISFLAILAGIVVSSIFIAILGNNPFSIFVNLFKGAFASQNQINNLLRLTGCFIIAALAVAFAFKAGLFNIGVSGQMMIGGGFAMIMALKYHLSWFLLILMAMLIAGLAASISGILKAWFNVHEVVSTLLLNWVWFFAIKYFTNTSFSYIKNTGGSIPLQGASYVGSNSDRTWIVIICALLAACSIAFILIKTTFGFSLKIVGHNKHVAKYAGINITKKIIYSMIISGALAGLLGGLTYLMKDQQIVNPKSLVLPNEGFDGIAIALLAFNSPIGIIIIALFWAILNIGSQYMAIINEISSQVVQMIIGIIIYFAAISVLFMRLKPVSLLRNLYYDLQDQNIKKERQKYYKSKKANSILFNDTIKKQKLIAFNKEELKFQKQEYKKKILQIKKKYKLEFQKIKNSNISSKEKNHNNLLISLAENKENFKIKNEFQNWKNDHHYNDIKKTKHDKHTSQIILKKEYKFQVAKIKKIRNARNIIGIYEKYRTNVMNLMTSYEILVSGIKIDIVDCKKTKIKLKKNNNPTSKIKLNHKNNLVKKIDQQIVEYKATLEDEYQKYKIGMRKLKENYVQAKQNAKKLKGET